MSGIVDHFTSGSNHIVIGFDSRDETVSITECIDPCPDELDKEPVVVENADGIVGVAAYHKASDSVFMYRCASLTLPLEGARDFAAALLHAADSAENWVSE
jgi:hypothetical protein